MLSQWTQVHLPASTWQLLSLHLQFHGVQHSPLDSMDIEYVQCRGIYISKTPIHIRIKINEYLKNKSHGLGGYRTRVKTSIVILLHFMSDCLLNRYAYICSPGLLSLQREAVNADIKLVRVLKMRYWAHSPRGQLCQHPLRPKWHWEREGRQNVSAKMWRGVLWNAIFWPWHGCHTLELTTAVAACKTPTIQTEPTKIYV